jgi:hypothetical protein
MKVDVLRAVAEWGEADARGVAEALGMHPEAAAMALLRAYRSGLLRRFGNGGSGGFRYDLSEKGWARLEYLDGQPNTLWPARSVSLNRKQGDDDMRSKKLHSGLYHCPECLYEVTLTAEGSLKCDSCGGRLYEGELPPEDEYNNEE